MRVGERGEPPIELARHGVLRGVPILLCRLVVLRGPGERAGAGVPHVLAVVLRRCRPRRRRAQAQAQPASSILRVSSYKTPRSRRVSLGRSYTLPQYLSHV